MIIGYNPGSTINSNWRLWDYGVTWGHIQPQQGVWDFSALDALVNQAEGTLMYVLGHPAEWAAKDGSDGKQAPWLPAGANRPPKTRDLWDHYCVAVAARYKGRIKYYQVWNEPADQMFYSGSYGDLARLTARAKDLINRTDPNAKIVSAPLQPRAAVGWPKQGHFLVNAYKKYDYPIDIWAAHIYPDRNRGPVTWENMITDVQKMLIVHGQAGKRLFVTETNYNVPNGPAIEPKLAQAYINKTKVLANKHGVDGLWWYAAPNQFGLQPIDLV